MFTRMSSSSRIRVYVYKNGVVSKFRVYVYKNGVVSKLGWVHVHE